MTDELKKDALPDIYSADPRRGEESASEESQNIADQIERQLHLNRIRNIFIVFFVFLLIVLISTMVLLSVLEGPAPAPLPPPKPEEPFFSSHIIPENELWVLDYRQVADQVNAKLESGDKPLSTQWIKNTAYNLIVGEQALVTKDYDQAVVYLEKALLIFPELESIHGPLGAAYIRLRQWEAAVQHLETAVQSSESFENVSNLGAALLGAGRLQEAEEWLLRAEEMQPDNPGCHKNLALLYHIIDLPEKAVDEFQAYFELYDDDLAAAEVFIRYLDDLGRREEAVEFINRQAPIFGQDADRLYLLQAELEARAGNAEGATAALEKAARYMTPQQALIQTNQEVFDTIRNTKLFQELVFRLELATVSMEE